MSYCSHVEHSHVKTNLVHQLYRVQTIGSLSNENFKNLLTLDQYKKYITKTIATWYSLTRDLLGLFIYCKFHTTLRFIKKIVSYKSFFILIAFLCLNDCVIYST